MVVGHAKKICSKSAINTSTDEEGFLYPIVDNEKCINCSHFEKVCPIHNFIKVDNGEPNVYAVKHKDEKIRYSSSSGGVFTAISDYILKNNGIIYGVIYNENFQAITVRGENFEDREKMKGSKYVQGNTMNTYKDVKDDLTIGNIVLNTGTPCQISGLYNFLNICKTEITNLVTCDIFCYGVPPQKQLSDYIDFKKDDNGIKSIRFRSKDLHGWHNTNVKIDEKILMVVIS